MRTPRGNLAATAAEDHIYAIGGIGGANEAQKVVEKYDTVGKAWATATSLPVPRGAPATIRRGRRSPF
ncbi:Kelch repeat-containing protein [Amycolatopsis orientalis]|uniref:Kelch repeat-containing protein n=1 Tax=Amycolatopsis orientalis TaxID=31958 RepID=UPI001428C861